MSRLYFVEYCGSISVILCNYFGDRNIYVPIQSEGKVVFKRETETQIIP